jgi:hypothetical protein
MLQVRPVEDYIKEIGQEFEIIDHFRKNLDFAVAFRKEIQKQLQVY